MGRDARLSSEIARLRAEYVRSKPASRKLFIEARRQMPGGVSSNLRYYLPFPLFFRRAKGGTVTDADGMEYIDFNLSYGAMMLGHNHPYVVRKSRRLLDSYGTTNFGANVDLEAELARRLRAVIPSAERVRYCNTGTEAVMLAIRMARGFRKKPLVAKMEGHYHGVYDDVLVSTSPGLREGGTRRNPRPVTTSRGIPREVFRNTMVLPFNDLESAERMIRKNRDKLACVIMELVSKGYVPAGRDFARGIREITERYGIVLIVDEVLTGFRVDFRGAQGHYGIRPDLSCFGKIAGGGVPLSVVAGRKDVMSVVSPRVREGPNYVYHSGTYNGSVLGLSHALATLDVLERKGTYPAVFRRTEQVRKGLREIFSDAGIDVQLPGIGAMFNVIFSARPVGCHRDTLMSDSVRRTVFDYMMLLNGVYIVPKRRLNFSAVHTAPQMEKTLEVASAAAAMMKG